jgi:hypothetical protein
MGDDADVDCVGDLLREYETKSNQSILIIWVCTVQIVRISFDMT